jgi:hypothetical protein
VTADPTVEPTLLADLTPDAALVSGDGRAVVLNEDCLAAMRALPDDSIDAVVTDPPYGLSALPAVAVTEVLAAWLAGDREATARGAGFMGKSWDAFVPPPAVWDEVYRVLKPGGHVLAFAGSRTVDLMGMSIRLAGFEIRDSLTWVYGCLTADAEILTESGWKPGIDAITGERVAQWDPATGAITLAPVQETFRAPWDGPMRVLRNSDTDQVLTPNHRVHHKAWQRRMVKGVRGGSWTDWQVSEAVHLPASQSVRLPVAGRHEGPGIGGTDYAALLGWVWTEGGFDPSGTGVRIYQSSVNRDKCDEIAALLDRIAPQHKRYDRERTYVRRNGDEHRYVESTWFITGDVANRVRADLPGKRPTYDLLWKMTSTETDAMIRAAMLGDGNGWGSGNAAFTQRYEDDLVWFQTALALTERSGKVGMRPDRDNGAVYLRQRATTDVQAKGRTVEDYTGEVWCVRVPTGAFVARRNGKVFITGNSGFPKSMDVSKAIDKAAGAEREVIETRKTQPKFAKAGDGRPQPKWEHHDTVDITAPATDDARTWEGWGTALKPSMEPIVVARKPLSGTVAANVLAYGTGALNIDATRVSTSDTVQASASGGDPFGAGSYEAGTGRIPSIAQGRWPANVLLSHGEDCRQVGSTAERVGGGATGSSGFVDGYTSGDGFVGREVTAPVWACVEGCPVAALDQQSGDRKASGQYDGDGSRAPGDHDTDFGGGHRPASMCADKGGASRFFPTFADAHDPLDQASAPFLYQAKAPTRERPSYEREGALRLRADLTDAERAYVLTELAAAGVKDAP